jgi:hypothetical protein
MKILLFILSQQQTKIEEIMLEPLYLTHTSYPAKSKIMSSQRLYNMYAEMPVESSPFKIPSLYNIPGLSEWITIENNFNPYYGGIVMNDFLYVVFGVKVYKIDTNKNITQIGTLETSPSKVRMVENGLQITILTTAGIAYYYEEDTDTFGQITDVDFPVASSIATLDGYTIVSEAETGLFYVSELRDTTNWSALAKATAEALSDNIVGLAVYQEQLFLMGERSIEIWYNSGVSAQPFRPVNQTFIQMGILSNTSFCVSMTGLFFIADNKSIFQTQSYQGTKISNHGIDYEISKLTNPKDVVVFSYIEEGHEFIVFGFITDKLTLVYDTSNQTWHNRGSLKNNEQIYWSCTDAINFDNKIICPSFKNGSLFYLDKTKFTEDGNTITSEVVSATLFADFNRFTVRELNLVLENGVGISDGSEPLIELFVSIDGGKVWNNPRATSIGKEGEYLTQIRWQNLGQGRSFIFKFRITDPVPRIIVGAYYEKVLGGR